MTRGSQLFGEDPIDDRNVVSSLNQSRAGSTGVTVGIYVDDLIITSTDKSVSDTESTSTMKSKSPEGRPIITSAWCLTIPHPRASQYVKQEWSKKSYLAKEPLPCTNSRPQQRSPPRPPLLKPCSSHETVSCRCPLTSQLLYTHSWRKSSSLPTAADPNPMRICEVKRGQGIINTIYSQKLK
jgi:hypothetical protein